MKMFPNPLTPIKKMIPNAIEFSFKTKKTGKKQTDNALNPYSWIPDKFMLGGKMEGQAARKAVVEYLSEKPLNLTGVSGPINLNRLMVLKAEEFVVMVAADNGESMEKSVVLIEKQKWSLAECEFRSKKNFFMSDILEAKKIEKIHLMSAFLGTIQDDILDGSEGYFIFATEIIFRGTFSGHHVYEVGNVIAMQVQTLQVNEKLSKELNLIYKDRGFLFSYTLDLTLDSAGPGDTPTYKSNYHWNCRLLDGLPRTIPPQFRLRVVNGNFSTKTMVYKSPRKIRVSILSKRVVPTSSTDEKIEKSEYSDRIHDITIHSVLVELLRKKEIVKSGQISYMSGFKQYSREIRRNKGVKKVISLMVQYLKELASKENFINKGESINSVIFAHKTTANQFMKTFTAKNRELLQKKELEGFNLFEFDDHKMKEIESCRDMIYSDYFDSLGKFIELNFDDFTELSFKKFFVVYDALRRVPTKSHFGIIYNFTLMAIDQGVFRAQGPAFLNARTGDIPSGLAVERPAQEKMALSRTEGDETGEGGGKRFPGNERESEMTQLQVNRATKTANTPVNQKSPKNEKIVNSPKNQKNDTKLEKDDKEEELVDLEEPEDLKLAVFSLDTLYKFIQTHLFQSYSLFSVKTVGKINWVCVKKRVPKLSQYMRFGKEAITAHTPKLNSRNRLMISLEKMKMVSNKIDRMKMRHHFTKTSIQELNLSSRGARTRLGQKRQKLGHNKPMAPNHQANVQNYITRSTKVFIMSWNLAGWSPNLKNKLECEELANTLSAKMDNPDLIILNFQEHIELKAQDPMVVYEILKKEVYGFTAWSKFLKKYFLEKNQQYEMINQVNYFALGVFHIVKKSNENIIQHQMNAKKEFSKIPGLPTKGSILSAIKLYDSSIVLANTHLPSGEKDSNIEQRKSKVRELFKFIQASKDSNLRTYDLMFLIGDLNLRVFNKKFPWEAFGEGGDKPEDALKKLLTLNEKRAIDDVVGIELRSDEEVHCRHHDLSIEEQGDKKPLRRAKRSYWLMGTVVKSKSATLEVNVDAEVRIKLLKYMEGDEVLSGVYHDLLGGVLKEGTLPELPSYKLVKKKVEMAYKKNRFPSWTDRIFYHKKNSSIKLKDNHLKTFYLPYSDHMPIYVNLEISTVQYLSKNIKNLFRHIMSRPEMPSTTPGFSTGIEDSEFLTIEHKTSIEPRFSGISGKAQSGKAETPFGMLWRNRKK